MLRTRDIADGIIRKDRWVAIAMDHYSRRVLGFALFKHHPTSVEIRAFLGRVFRKAKPKHLITDQGTQFNCDGFRDWCKRLGIKLRYGAIGEHGSIAVIERFIRTLKDEGTRRLSCVPLVREAFRRELALFVDWYNGHRPHMTLKGSTPDEVYFHRHPRTRYPRWEPRAAWPRTSPCAKPRAPSKGRAGTAVKLTVAYFHGRKHLPIVSVAAA